VKSTLASDLTYESTPATPMVFMLNLHPSRAARLVPPPDLAAPRSERFHHPLQSDGFATCVRVWRRRPVGGSPATPSLSDAASVPSRVEPLGRAAAVSEPSHYALV